MHSNCPTSSLIVILHSNCPTSSLIVILHSNCPTSSLIVIFCTATVPHLVCHLAQQLSHIEFVILHSNCPTSSLSSCTATVPHPVCYLATQLAAAALLERTVAMQLGNWSSAPYQLTMGPPQGPPLSPVLFNVDTKGLADLNQNGPSKILTEADDGLRYKTSKDSLEAAEVMQQQLDPSDVSTLDLSSIQTRHRHCGVMSPHWISHQSRRGTGIVE